MRGHRCERPAGRPANGIARGCWAWVAVGPAWIGRDWCNIALQPNIAPVTAQPLGPREQRTCRRSCAAPVRALVNLTRTRADRGMFRGVRIGRQRECSARRPATEWRAARRRGASDARAAVAPSSPPLARLPPRRPFIVLGSGSWASRLGCQCGVFPQLPGADGTDSKVVILDTLENVSAQWRIRALLSILLFSCGRLRFRDDRLDR